MPRLLSKTAALDNMIVTKGATATELGLMFKMERKEIYKRLDGLPPSGMHGTSELWHIRDAAPRLIRFDDTMTEVVSQVLATHHTDLPKMLSKEYWYGQNQRLRYLKDIGDLWDTQAVVELASEVFKTLRLSLMLAADAVERETGLTVRQREIVEDLMHQALFEAREKLVADLEHLRKDTRGKAFAPKESQRPAGPYTNGHRELDEWGDPIPRPGDPDYL